MKKLLLFISIITLTILNASARTAGGDEDFELGEDATHIPAMVWVSDGDIDEAIADLESQGVEILNHRGDILLALVPLEGRSNVRRTRGVGRVEFSRPRVNTPMMNQARYFNQANFIGEGRDLPQPYTGKGVVVGVCDIGIDTRHPNFLTADGSECRIRRVTHYEEFYGRHTTYDSPDDIYEWETDDPDSWHGTHTTGIAAGAYPRSGYQSLAPEADIVFSGSQLSDVGLLAGVEDIIAYAKEVGKPAVVNLSMGNYTGPHDGTSLFCQYLDRCADDAIICISAGNEGANTISMSYDFSESNKEFRVLPNDWAGRDYAGDAEVWSLDSTPFEIAHYWHASGNYNNRIDAYPFLISEDGEEKTWRISSTPGDPDFDNTFADHFYEGGYVKITYGVSPINNRYYARVEFQLRTDECYASEAWALYWIGMWIKGRPGTHVDAYCGKMPFLRKESTFPAPDNKLCISDLATGYRTISVGMTNNTALNETSQPGSGYARGDICIHSSYGTLPTDGRVFPLTCAPGAEVMSSMSSAYLRNHREEIADMPDKTTLDNGETVYWQYCLGTSMSCPYVASTIATWLEAYPQLTSDEAISIVKKTNQTAGYPDPENPRHGQGWFSPYAGMQQVVSLAALKVGTVDQAAPTVRVEKGMLLIGNPNADRLTVAIHDASGMLRDRRTSNGTIENINLDHLAKGIYIVTVTSPDGKAQKLKLII